MLPTGHDVRQVLSRKRPAVLSPRDRNGIADCEGNHHGAQGNDFCYEPARAWLGVFVHFAGGSQRGRIAMNVASVLVVADEPQIRRVMRTTLSSHGYVIREATTGEGGVGAVGK